MPGLPRCSSTPPRAATPVQEEQPGLRKRATCSVRTCRPTCSQNISAVTGQPSRRRPHAQLLGQQNTLGTESLGDMQDVGKRARSNGGDEER